MEKFVIKKNGGKISSVNRTIRMKPELFEKVMLLSEENGVSFNRIVNQCIDYALKNMGDNTGEGGVA